jgi:hypothetical protein
MHPNGVFLLKAVYKFSANKSCQKSARAILLAYANGNTKELEKQLAYAGGFITACVSGDVFDAWLRADGHNRLAIELGMSEFFVKKGDPWLEGIPRDLPPVKGE